MNSPSHLNNLNKIIRPNFLVPRVAWAVEWCYDDGKDITIDHYSLHPDLDSVKIFVENSNWDVEGSASKKHFESGDTHQVRILSYDIWKKVRNNILVIINVGEQGFEILDED